METKEEAEGFIEECNRIIKKIEKDTEKVFNEFQGIFGTVTDYESFVQFYFNFLKRCPNSKIIAGHNNEEEAKILWSAIDKNDNHSLDKEEIKTLVKSIVLKAQKLTKDYFNIE